MKTAYIVKSWEEVYGNEYTIVFVPENTKEEDVYINLEIAKKYSSINYSEKEILINYSEKEFDNHFNEMVKYCIKKFGNNGQAVFNYYLEHYCGYKVEKLKEDFFYEL